MTKYNFFIKLVCSFGYSRIIELLNFLNEKEKDIIKMNYGIFPYEKEFKLKEIGEKYKIRIEKVRQIILRSEHYGFERLVLSKIKKEKFFTYSAKPLFDIGKILVSFYKKGKFFYCNDCDNNLLTRDENCNNYYFKCEKCGHISGSKIIDF